MRFVDGRALRLTRRGVEVANSYGPFEAARLREIGADLLGRFPSPGSAARLRAMLGDRTVERTKEGRRAYPVRKEAYEVLRRWGIDVAEPVLEEG